MGISRTTELSRERYCMCDCEFEEETGTVLHHEDYPKLDTPGGSFTGSNYKSYKHCYLAKMDERISSS